MSAEYPAAVYTPRTKANRNGVVFQEANSTVAYAEDFQAVDAEIVAIENELGQNPKGAYASVAAYLAALAESIGTGGAFSRTAVVVAASDYSGKANADYICDGTDDDLVIGQAMAAVAAAGGGIVHLSPGNYEITTQITNLSHVKLIGSGVGVTILKCGIAYDWAFYNENAIVGASIESMTLDVENAEAASGITMNKATECLINKVLVKNVAAWGWGIRLGGEASEGSFSVVSFRNKIIDCGFDTHAGSLEMLLIYNAEDTDIIRPYFINNDDGPILGLWQSCYRTRIDCPRFVDCGGSCIYYSITCDDIVISDMFANNCGSGIIGSHVSDNGTNGILRVNGIRIINPIIINPAGTDSTGIQIGAANDIVITNPRITGYDNGISIDGGNFDLDTIATNWIIENPQISNGNPSAANDIIHPGIHIGGPSGSLYGKIINGSIYDNRTTVLQSYPITAGDGAYDYIEIIGNRLTPGEYGESIAFHDGGSFGAHVVIRDNIDYSAGDIKQDKTAGAPFELTTDNQYSGEVLPGVAGAALAFGQIVYLDPTDSRWEKTDANAAANANGDTRGIVGVCVKATSADGQATKILLRGFVWCEDIMPTFTANGAVFVSETPGEVTQTAPVATNSVTRRIGTAYGVDVLYFCPDNNFSVHA